MTFVITQPCIGVCDSECVTVCPVDCIAGSIPVEKIRKTPKENRSHMFPNIQLYINPEECICCGACEPECPVGAIFEEDEVPPEWNSYIEKNAEFFI